jgi:hypothetical protein
VWSNIDDLRRPLSDPTKALGLARWIRTTILGLAAVAIGVGWLWDVWPLIGLALIIAGEETLETTSAIRAIEAWRRERAAPPPRLTSLAALPAISILSRDLALVLTTIRGGRTLGS